jgi:hypothetical protein
MPDAAPAAAPARPLPCVRCQRKEQSAAAALATVAQFHELSIGAQEIAPFVGLPSLTELGELVVASRMLGFESVPLEGGYDDLPEVARPNIVLFKDGRFVTLFEIDAKEARVADPLAGVRTLLRDEFSSQWNGDCLQVVPARLDDARRRLADRRRVWTRLAQPRPLLLLAGALAIAVPLAIDGSFAAAALGVAALSSLWLVLFQASCAQCSRAHQLAGALPLDRLGALFYASLLIAAPFEPRLAGYALCAAVGGHASLLALLARERVLCRPCVVTAVAAAAAAAVLARGLPLVAVALAFVAGAAALGLAVPFFRRVARAHALFESRRVALEWLTQAGEPPPGKVRVVVWKRSGCAACLFYEAVFKQALIEEFQEVVAIDERDASRLRVPTPLILVAGTVRFLFVGLPGRDDDYQALQRAVESARDPACAAVGRLGGVQLIEPPYSDHHSN